MATFLYPSGAVISGDPVAVADLKAWGKNTYNDVRSLRQHSEMTTPPGVTPAESENTITTDVGPVTKYELKFSSIMGNPAQTWTFANQDDLDAEYLLVEAALDPS